MRKLFAAVLGVLIGISISILVFWGGILLIAAVSGLTHSGLFGICGPYGHDWSLFLQLLMLLGILVLAPLLGFKAARRAQARLVTSG